MKSMLSIAVAFCLLVLPSSLLAGGRIDPAGIGGSIVISGMGRPVEAHAPFFELAGGKEAKVVILRFDTHESSQGETAQLLEAWEAAGGRSIQVLQIRAGVETAADVSVVEKASGVWLVAGGPEKLTAERVGGRLKEALGKLVAGGGVAGGSGAAGDAFAGELGLLPSSFVDTQQSIRFSASPVRQALEERPSLVGFEIEMDAALIVSGRRMRAVGGGDGDSKVQIHLAASERREARVIELGRFRDGADLTALRKAAIERAADEPFPADEPPSPEVENGTLIIIGGGGMPSGIIPKFVELAGGEEGSIVVFPTANPDPLPEKPGIEVAFRKAGAKEVTVLAGRSLDQVESDDYLDVLRRATGLWFGGGRQWRFADAYLDTQALEEMHGVLARGGVIMGSSAGASIQADYLARANPLGNRDIMAEGYERGLGFIKGVAIDQHFAQRRRFRDMTSLVDRYPQLLGIGIDEGTALIVQGKIGTVEGRSEVHFYDRRKPVTGGQPDYESVGDGGSYDLVDRKILETGEPARPGK